MTVKVIRLAASPSQKNTVFTTVKGPKSNSPNESTVRWCKAISADDTQRIEFHRYSDA